MARRESVQLPRQNSANSISLQIVSPTKKRKRQIIPDSSDEDHSGSSVKKLSKSQLSKPVTTSFVITNSLFTKIYQGCESLKIEKLDKIIVDVCKYWALKRQSKRGVPLLKRLLVEPWIQKTPSKAADEKAKIENYKVTFFVIYTKGIEIIVKTGQSVIFSISNNQRKGRRKC